jgi:hypothetical protein
MFDSEMHDLAKATHISSNSKIHRAKDKGHVSHSIDKVKKRGNKQPFFCALSPQKDCPRFIFLNEHVDVTIQRF